MMKAVGNVFKEVDKKVGTRAYFYPRKKIALEVKQAFTFLVCRYQDTVWLAAIRHIYLTFIVFAKGS